MRVEAPTTFMTAHQQSKDNQRRDRLDQQKLAFTIFDEKRARDKHQYQMDLGEEQVRHAKTMNPLMESLRLHENELKWGTLESDIGYAEERTRHAKAMNPLQESFQRYKNKLAWDTVDSSIARHHEQTDWMERHNDLKESKLRSDLDHLKWTRKQTTDYYGTSATPEQNEAIAEQRALMDETVSKGLKGQIDDFDIQANQSYIDKQVGDYTVGRFDDAYLNDPDRMDSLASDILAGTLDMPARTKVNQYNLGFGDYNLQKYGQGMQWKVLEGMQDRYETQQRIYKEKVELYDKANELWEKGKKDAANDIYTRLEQMKNIGLLQGGNMQQFMQGGK